MHRGNKLATRAEVLAGLCLFLLPVPMSLYALGLSLFFFLFFFPLAHSCPASLGASEATGREMPAVWQGERTSWCVFPQPEGELRSNKGQ